MLSIWGSTSEDRCKCIPRSFNLPDEFCPVLVSPCFDFYARSGANFFPFSEKHFPKPNEEDGEPDLPMDTTYLGRFIGSVGGTYLELWGKWNFSHM